MKPVRVKRGQRMQRCRVAGCRRKTRHLYEVGVGKLVHVCTPCSRLDDPKLKPHLPPTGSHPVTDPELDAPDGAVVDGFERVGDRWEPA